MRTVDVKRVRVARPSYDATVACTCTGSRFARGIGLMEAANTAAAPLTRGAAQRWKAAAAIEELYTDLPFQIGQRLADHRLGASEAPASRGEIPFLRRGYERP